jgi:hypothetical protein
MSELELDLLEDAMCAQTFAQICNVIDDALNSGPHRPEFWSGLTSELRAARRRASEADSHLVVSCRELIDESMQALRRSGRFRYWDELTLVRPASRH